MTERRVFLGSLLSMLVATLSLSSQAGAQNESPETVVREAAEQVLELIEGRREELEANPGELRDLVGSILLPRFDRNYAAYLVLGRHGRAASAEQRSQFRDALYEYLLDRYGHGLLSLTAERLQILPYRGAEDAKRATVRTFVILDDGQRIPVNYDLRLGDSGWRVFDLAIEGISYINNLRSQLDEEIERNGLDSVIARLNTEAAAPVEAGDDAP